MGDSEHISALPTDRIIAAHLWKTLHALGFDSGRVLVCDDPGAFLRQPDAVGYGFASLTATLGPDHLLGDQVRAEKFTKTGEDFDLVIAALPFASSRTNLDPACPRPGVKAPRPARAPRACPRRRYWALSTVCCLRLRCPSRSTPNPSRGIVLAPDPLAVDASPMHLRTALTEDFELLASLVVEAVNWTGETRMTREQVMAEPELGHYVTGWRRTTDFGLVALADDGAPLGAIWWRLFPDDDPGYGFIACDVPELSMAVLPGRKGNGVGRALLRECIEEARIAGHSALSLSVEDGNDVARALYERHHFRVVGRTGGSDTMRLDLEQGSA